MTGFGDWDYGRPGSPRRRPRSLRPDPPPTVTVTFHHVLTREFAREVEYVDRARRSLSDSAEHYAETHGMTVVTGHWSTDPPNDAMRTVTIRLEAEMLLRTDGEWAAIHQAIAEDAADRAEAAAGKTAVDDRLDALASAAAVWTARDPRELREALTAPHSASLGQLMRHLLAARDR